MAFGDIGSNITIIILIIAATGIGAWLAVKILNKLAEKLTNSTKTRLDDTILNALKTPIVMGIILLGLWLCLKQVQNVVTLSTHIIDTIFFLIYWFLIYLLAYRLVVNLTEWYRKEVAYKTETDLDEQIIPFLRRILLIVVSVIAIIILLGHFNVNTSTISAFVTTLGIGSLAIALAAQTTLSDTFSGFAIMLDRPFRIGDRIELRDLNTWGDVIDIGLRSTRILTRDHRFVVIPNSIISTSLIVNHSIPSNVFRVQTHITVAYGVDIDEVKQILVEAVTAQDWIMHSKPVEALFLEFRDFGMWFRVRCWIENYAETRRTIDKLNSCIYKALVEADIEIPLPQRVVHLKNDVTADRRPPTADRR